MLNYHTESGSLHFMSNDVNILHIHSSPADSRANQVEKRFYIHREGGSLHFMRNEVNMVHIHSSPADSCAHQVQKRFCVLLHQKRR